MFPESNQRRRNPELATYLNKNDYNVLFLRSLLSTIHRFPIFVVSSILVLGTSINNDILATRSTSLILAYASPHLSRQVCGQVEHAYKSVHAGPSYMLLLLELLRLSLVTLRAVLVASLVLFNFFLLILRESQTAITYLPLSTDLLSRTILFFPLHIPPHSLIATREFTLVVFNA